VFENEIEEQKIEDNYFEEEIIKYVCIKNCEE
jgi:hypothetical protein